MMAETSAGLFVVVEHNQDCVQGLDEAAPECSSDRHCSGSVLKRTEANTD